MPVIMTLKELINNNPVSSYINNSAIGQKFEDSALAKCIDKAIGDFYEGMDTLPKPLSTVHKIIGTVLYVPDYALRMWWGHKIDPGYRPWEIAYPDKVHTDLERL